MTIILKAANSDNVIEFAGSKRAADYLRRHGADLKSESKKGMTFCVEDPSAVHSRLSRAGII